MADDKPVTIEDLGLGFLRPDCYFCEQPIQDGETACEIEIDDTERADAHRKCFDHYLFERGFALPGLPS